MTDLIATTPGLYPLPDWAKDELSELKGHQKGDLIDGDEGPEIADAYQRARSEVVDAQADAGLDRVVEGQLRWDDMLAHPLTTHENVETGGIVRYYDNNNFYRDPQVQGELTPSGDVAAELDAVETDALQAVLPGPYSLADLASDDYYGDEAEFLDAIADYLAGEIDGFPGHETLFLLEPSLVENPPDEDENERASEAIDRVADATDADVVVHTYWGAVPEKTYAHLMDADVDAIGFDFVTDAERLDDGRFRLVGNEGAFVAERVVLGVGFNDERPDPPLPRTGKGLHYCLHCDAYMFVDESVYVMGHSDSAAYVAMIMLNFTDEVDLLLRGDEPTWSDETDELVRAHPVDIVEAEISGMAKRDDGWLESFEFEDGTVREYKGGFAMYGSNYNTTLFEALDVDLDDDGTVPVDDHGRTSVDGVFAVGDITPGHNQIPVAMGTGAKAGIAIHMELREFPKSLDEIRAEGAVSVDDVPGISPGLLDKAKQFKESHADD